MDACRDKHTDRHLDGHTDTLTDARTKCLPIRPYISPCALLSIRPSVYPCASVTVCPSVPVSLSVCPSMYTSLATAAAAAAATTTCMHGHRQIYGHAAMRVCKYRHERMCMCMRTRARVYARVWHPGMHVLQYMMYPSHMPVSIFYAHVCAHTCPQAHACTHVCAKLAKHMLPSPPPKRLPSPPLPFNFSIIAALSKLRVCMHTCEDG